MYQRTQPTLTDSQRTSLRSFTACSPTSLSDLSRPFSLGLEKSERGFISSPTTAAPGSVWRNRLADFLEATKIEVVLGSHETALEPFVLWEPADWVSNGAQWSQRSVLRAMELERLIIFLKARQLGISWLVCGYALHQCLTVPGYPVLALSRGQDEANELIRRIGILYHQHADKKNLPALTTENKGSLEWDGYGRVISLAATKNAGRSLTAALAVLDEWAFMQWPRETLAAIKPTIDAGGKLFIISSADGMGTPYHQHWLAAKSGANGYKAIFLPWYARPDRDAGWRERKLAESGGDEAGVKREYPANDIEAFTHAAGLIYSVWSDGPDDGNVTMDAEYLPDGGEIIWAVDDGYVGKIDPATGQYTAQSHPRVIGFYQQRSDGTLCRFDESYAVGVLSEDHIAQALVMPYRLADVLERDDGRPIVEQAWAARGRLGNCYPEPDFAVVDSSAAELRGRLRDADITNYGGTHPVDEGIKNMRRWVAKDANGRRRFLVHPRCGHFRYEMVAYREDDKGNPVKQHDHGVDEARMILWKLREEG